MGKLKADGLFAWDVLSLLRIRLVKSLEGTQNLNTYGMLKHDMKIAWRNLLRNKSYSFLNIAGLAVGMACSIFILLWIQNEVSFDKFHTDHQHIYRLTCDGGGGFKAAVSPAGMPKGLKNEIPEITAYTRISKPAEVLIETENRQYGKQYGFFADENFLSFFDFPLLEGNPQDILSDPNGILISASTARRYFGHETALGKVIRKENQDDFIVKGVLKDAPSNSHLQYDFILPMSFLAQTNRDLIRDSWGNFNFYSYLKTHAALEPGAVLAALNPKVNQLYTDKFPKSKIKFTLQPLTDIHLHSNLQIDVTGHGNAQYVNIFFIVTIFILGIACINFMNLATAQSSKRAKEVGIRKVVGIKRLQLIKLFLLESVLVSFLSVILALLVVYLLLPSFNALIGKQLSFSLLNYRFILILVGIALSTGLVSGSYPSIFLSSFKPLMVLKGNFNKNGKGFRNALVVVQFFISIVLVVGVAVVYSQMDYIKNRNLGFDKANLLYLPFNNVIGTQQNAFRDALESSPYTQNYTILSELPANIVSGTVDIDWEGQDPEMRVVVPDIAIDEKFLSLFQVELIAGRGFSADLLSDSSKYVINHRLANIMNLSPQDCIGKKLNFHNREGTIIGVVKDFNFKPLQYGIEPLVLVRQNRGGYFVIKTQPGQNEASIEQLETTFETFNPGQLMEFGFVDQELHQQYEGERQMGKIFNIFGVLAIFISCLGLYGLAAFVAEQHTKELGIRKVLGASGWSLASLLSSGFIKLIFIAIVIALPTAFYFMNEWLTSFAYHVEISWWIMVAASMMTLFIAIVTISFQVIKATHVNPIESLRTE